MLQYAFVIKNFSPISFKVKILHSKYGKIDCVYAKDHQAKLLTVGSLIACNIEHVNHRYSFSYLDILYSPMALELEQLEFIHKIMLICLRLLPDSIPVEDVFLCIIDLYKKNFELTLRAQKLLLLRLFFLCEIFEENVQIYKIAMQDPLLGSLYDAKLVEKYLEIGFHTLHQQKNLEK